LAGPALGRGVSAFPGAAVGRLVFDPESAAQWLAMGEDVILARREVSPEDFHTLSRAAGLLTSRGGATRHAAVAGRAVWQPCIAGAEALEIDVENRRLSASGITLVAGDWISLDAT